MISMLIFSVVTVVFTGFAAPSSAANSNENFRNNPKFREEINLDHPDFKRINQLIFELTNEIRAKYKLPVLRYSTELEKTAEMHARDMVKGNFFNHINEKDRTKRTPNDRAKLCNIANPYLAENLIEGFGLQYNSNESVYLRGKGKFSKTKEGELIKAHSYLTFCEIQMDRWMNSREHRKNILSKDALEFGCGVAEFANPDFNNMPTFYVVQNFQCYEPVKKINQ
jgi:uncharacterized protein YkwD